MGLPFVPPLRFIDISSFIQCYLFYVYQCEKSCFHHFIPVAFIIIYPSKHCSVVYEIMYNTYKLFIPKCEWQSVLWLFILCLPDVWRVVLTLHLIIGYLHVYCVNMIWKCKLCEYWYLSCVLLLFRLSKFWCMLSCSPESNYNSKVKRKASGLPHMIGLSFIGKCMSNFMPEINVVVYK